MPIYDYKCSSCGKIFEVLLGPDERAACPQCGGNAVERQLSAPGWVGVAAKGGGLPCGKETTCCGSATPCAKPDCHK